MITPDWKFITLKSYTAWAFYALAAITLAPDLIYYIWGVDTNPAIWSALQIWTIVLGIVGRITLQPEIGAVFRRAIVFAIIIATVIFASRAMAQTTEGATMRVLVPHVIRAEGEHRCRDAPSLHCAYLDIVNVPTICFGETKGVKIGDRTTDAQCRIMLINRLKTDYRAALHRYFTTETRLKRLTPERDAAYVSLAYNVGVAGAGRSTAVRRLNAGDIEGGCHAIGWWNKAGGRVVRGLTLRRAIEVDLCLRGL